MEKTYSYTKDFKLMYEITDVTAFLNLTSLEEKKSIYQSCHCSLKMAEMINRFSKEKVTEDNNITVNRLAEEVRNTFDLLNGWLKRNLTKEEYKELQDDCRKFYTQYVINSVMKHQDGTSKQ